MVGARLLFLIIPSTPSLLSYEMLTGCERYLADAIAIDVVITDLFNV